MSDTMFPQSTSGSSSVPHQPKRELISDEMIEALRETKPWVRLISIVGFVLAVLIGLAGVRTAAESTTGIGTPGRFPMFFMGLGQIGLAVLYIAPSIFLHRYSRAIDGVLTSADRAPAISEALQSQKSFWKFTGIVASMLIGVMLVVAVGMFVLATIL